MKQHRFGFGIMLVALAALLGGCSGGTENNDGGAAMPMSLQGVVHGGQAPIVGTSVTLHAASQQGLSDATVVATATTDSNGNFNFSFTCPSPTTLMYVTGTGGNPGGGANSAIHLMSVLGPCQSLHRSATINELTTVAAAYTLNGFIGPSGCFDCNGGLPGSVDNITGTAPGLPNAIGNAALLVDPITGLDAATLRTSAECPSSGTVPANCLTVKKLNTAADALAACVNSSGPGSSQCLQLFDCATVGTTSSSSTACTPAAGAALPTDTLQAMLNIVRNPAKISIGGITQAANRDVVFSPVASSSFTDYTLSLNLTDGGFNSPQNIAVDGSGNIWVTSFNSNSVTKLSPNGVPLSGGSGFIADTGSYGIAFDASGNAWISACYDGVAVLSAAGAPMFGSPIASGTGGLGDPHGIAVSPNGDVWVTNFGGTYANQVVSRFTATGGAVGSGYGTGHDPLGIAIDASGYVFVTNNDEDDNGVYSSISEFSPAGTLVKTITDGGLHYPAGAAIDVNGNLWVANADGSTPSLTKITLASESEVSAANFTGGGLSGPSGGIATDASGNVWVMNVNSHSVSEFNNAGAALSPSAGFIGAGVDTASFQITPAVDPSGNLWIPNTSNNSVTVFFGVAAPTLTPLVAALTHGFEP